MKNNDLLIIFASWEDRFKIGFDRDLKKAGIEKALVFFFGSYADRTQENRHAVEEVCKEKCIEYIPAELDIEQPADNWRTVLECTEDAIAECPNILIDISTMPREIIWYVLWMIEQSKREARYVYHSPQKYGNEWLSRDPRAPRLVYKLSGIAMPSAKTALLVTVGFDPSRADRLVSCYEPSKLLIGIQSSSSFQRNDEVMAGYVEKYKKEYDCSVFELDAYADDQGMAAIQEVLRPLGTSHNILTSSLGPKLTAISLYKLKRLNENVGLVYAPANQFNPNYSSGIGSCFEGEI